MELKAIEGQVIECITANIKMSGEVVPHITNNTCPLRDLPNFDSLRTIEVMVALSAKTGCELEVEDIFARPNPQTLRISELAKIIKQKLETNK